MVTLNLGGEKRPFQITFRTIALMQAETKHTFASMGNLSASDMESLIYHGLRSGYRAQNEGLYPKWERKALQNWLDTADGFKAMRDAQKEFENALQVMNEGAEDAQPAGNGTGGAAPN